MAEPVYDDMLSLLADSILTHSIACLESTPSGVPTERFVSHDKPPEDCCDLIAVWVKQIRPTISFPRTTVDPSPCGDLMMALDVAVKLVRPCWPTQTGDKNDPFPGADVVHAAATNLLIDARHLWCCLRSAANEGVLIPYEGFDIVFGNMTPTRGGGCAGWVLDLVVEVPGCCWPYVDTGS